MILWTETVDVYEANGTALIQSEAAAYVEIEAPKDRVALQGVSRSTLAQLWLPTEAGSGIKDGNRIYRREADTWWTVRGMPQMFSAGEGSHVEVTISADAPDAFFGALVKSRGVTAVFSGAASITHIQLEISEVPDFTATVLEASSLDDQSSWFFANGAVWSPIDAAGLPSASVQTVAFFTSAPDPLRHYFLRWTPLAGGTVLAGQQVLGAI